MNILKIYEYNNYFNRIVKKESTLADYSTAGTLKYTSDSVNFEYNDGVTTSQILNYAGTGDYLIVTNDNSEILSRWFITEHQKIRGNQYRLDLKRDLLVDFYNNVINAPTIIDRALINNENNPLLFNPEGFSFNQIKQKEILLKDHIETPWYVLYFKKGSGTLSGSFNPNALKYNKKINSPIASSIYYAGNQKYVDNTNIRLTYRVEANNLAWSYFSDQYNMNISATGMDHIYDCRSSLNSVIWFNNSFQECKTQLNTAFTNTFTTLQTALLTDTGNTASLTEAQYKELSSIGEEGILIYDSDNKLFKVNVREVITNEEGALTSGSTKNTVETIIGGTTLSRSEHFGDNTLHYGYKLHTFIISNTEVTTGAVNWSLWPSGGVEFAHTADSQFDIIAIPYDNIRAWATIPHDCLGYTAKLLVDSIAQEAGDKLVDIQLLPYCPVQELEVYNSTTQKYESHQVDMNKADSGVTQRIIYDDQEHTATIVVYVPNSNFSFDIECQLRVPSMVGKSAAISAKVDNECSVYKVVSPNYNGSFEFSVAKNQGVDYFNVDVSLIPYNPYMHINPNFKGLYGTDWNDSKGLLCGGDFSLPRYTDQWAQYELNNKNYQQIFDRQIRNLDFTQSQERVQALVGAATGTLVGAAGGALVGSKAGPAGMAVGATVGAATSAVGGIIDYAMLDARQAEQKSFAIDNYKYQLGNIKALPDTINKVTPYTFNNKIFPFVEVYSATQEEKNLFMNYLDYKSMTIQAIGTIATYIQSNKTFISGNIIRLDDLGLASHEAYEIYDEIKKGVYI